MSKLFSLLLIVTSTCMYQILAEKVNPKANPFISLVFTYITALLVALILYNLTNKDSKFISDIKSVNRYSILLGFAICLLETGWILAYRSGWTVGKLSPVVSVFSMIVLAFIGIFIYQNKFTFMNIAGLIIAAIGVLLTLK